MSIIQEYDFFHEFTDSLEPEECSFKRIDWHEKWQTPTWIRFKLEKSLDSLENKRGIIVKVRTNSKYWLLESRHEQTESWSYSLNKLIARALGLSKKEIIIYRYQWHTNPKIYIPAELAYCQPSAPHFDSFTVPNGRNFHFTSCQIIPWLDTCETVSYVFCDFLILECPIKRLTKIPRLVIKLELYDTSMRVFEQTKLAGSSVIELLRTKQSVLFALPWQSNIVRDREDFDEYYQTAFDWCVQRYATPELAVSPPFRVCVGGADNYLKLNATCGCPDISILHIGGFFWQGPDCIQMNNFFNC